jgi:hypothetical protein
LRFGVVPAERVLGVGETFTATAEAYGCLGSKRLTETWVWRTADTAVVAVDSLAGRITGRAPGVALVGVRGRTYGDVGMGVRVTVR